MFKIEINISPEEKCIKSKKLAITSEKTLVFVKKKFYPRYRYILNSCLKNNQLPIFVLFQLLESHSLSSLEDLDLQDRKFSKQLYKASVRFFGSYILVVV